MSASPARLLAAAPAAAALAAIALPGERAGVGVLLVALALAAVRHVLVPRGDRFGGVCVALAPALGLAPPAPPADGWWGFSLARLRARDAVR